MFQGQAARRRLVSKGKRNVRRPFRYGGSNYSGGGATTEKATSVVRPERSRDWFPWRPGTGIPSW